MRLSTILPVFLFALSGCRSDPGKPDGSEDALVDTTPDDQDGDGADAETDCDDSDATISPTAEEVCDGIDNNCDGQVDEGTLQTFYADADGDGYGSPDTPVEACERSEGLADNDADCDDAEALVSPDGVESCNEVDDDCDGLVDEDVTSTYYIDADGDGFGDVTAPTEACSEPPGYASVAGDCDDGNLGVNPDATELCNDIDDNCDGAIDEDSAADAATWYADSDRDGYGDPAVSSAACSAPTNTVADATDCDDGNSAANPGAIELCNGFDDNCDGDIDEDTAADVSTWYADTDGDGYGDPDVSSVACSAPTDTVADATDCDDDSAAVKPGATEICNDIDDDCDGDIDDDDVGLDTSTATTWYVDTDLDGYGTSSTLLACDDPGSAALDSGDCDDGNSDAYPGAPEPCSAGADLDCDGSTAAECASCLEILDDGLSTGDGLYTIDPDGAGGSGSIDTWCDMSTDGGGWTLVQRTVWDWSESSQLATTQSQWFGTTYGDPSPGYAFRMAGEVWPDLQIEQEHMLVHVARDSSSGADCSELYYTGTGGVYTTSSTSTTITAISSTVSFVNNTTMSTSDAGPSSRCPNDYDAVPWFYSSCCSTCPTFFGSYWTDEAHPMAHYISSTTDIYGNVDSDVCSSGAAVSSSIYEGINDMAYFLR